MRGLRASALALGFVWAGAAGAGSFSISPVRVTLPGTGASAMLTVRNDGSEPAVIELVLEHWAQENGRDVMSPTRDLLATPPIFQLPVGGVQIVRVGLRTAVVDPHREAAYRLLLKEVTPPTSVQPPGLKIALNISLPVFVMPTAAQPLLRWTARYEDGWLALSARNDGNVHVHVQVLELAAPDRMQPFVATYVLPGERREWRLRHEPPAGGELHLVARTDAGDMSVVVPVTAR